MGDEKSKYKQENKKIQNISSIKIVYFAILTVVTKHFVNELLRFTLVSFGKTPLHKIKHKALILKKYKHGGLKCVDLTFNIISPQTCLKLKTLR